LNNTGAVLVFGGTRDRDDLQFWSTLTGERDEPITTTDLHGRVASRTVRRVPVLQPAQLANLPAGRVVVIRRGLPPVIGRAPMAWRRRDVRALAFGGRHPMLVARLSGWAAAVTAWCARVTGPVRAGAAGAGQAFSRIGAPVWAWCLTRLGRRGHRTHHVLETEVGLRVVRWPGASDDLAEQPDPDELAVGPRMNGRSVGRRTR
jgi:hypothetical protein